MDSRSVLARIVDDAFTVFGVVYVVVAFVVSNSAVVTELPRQALGDSETSIKASGFASTWAGSTPAGSCAGGGGAGRNRLLCMSLEKPTRWPRSVRPSSSLQPAGEAGSSPPVGALRSHRPGVRLTGRVGLNPDPIETITPGLRCVSPQQGGHVRLLTAAPSAPSRLQEDPFRGLGRANTSFRGFKSPLRHQ